MTGWFNKLKSVLSSAIQKIKSILPNLKQTKEQDIFSLAQKYIQTKEDINK